MLRFALKKRKYCKMTTRNSTENENVNSYDGNYCYNNQQQLQTLNNTTLHSTASVASGNHINANTCNWAKLKQ